MFQANELSKILIVGQAPGKLAHETHLPFNDLSGDRLRTWLGIDRSTFYDPEHIALLPMAFCYPGTGIYGDLPPPKICAKMWRSKFLAKLTNIRLTITCGVYAAKWHVRESRASSLTEIVKRWQELPSNLIALPHPSPRNNGWLKQNSWFEGDVLPVLKERVAWALNQGDS